MELRPELLLRAAAKAMTDVVLPALDADNKLAQEQGNLVLAALNLVVERLPQMYRFDCDQLARSVGLAAELESLAGEAGTADAEARGLGESAAAGAEVLARAKAAPDELVVANHDLSARIGALVAALYAEAPDTVLGKVGRAVTAHAAEQLLRDRSWVAPQGWEPGAPSLPELGNILA